MGCLTIHFFDRLFPNVYLRKNDQFCDAERMKERQEENAVGFKIYEMRIPPVPGLFIRNGRE